MANKLEDLAQDLLKKTNQLSRNFHFKIRLNQVDDKVINSLMMRIRQLTQKITEDQETGEICKVESQGNAERVGKGDQGPKRTQGEQKANQSDASQRNKPKPFDIQSQIESEKQRANEPNLHKKAEAKCPEKKSRENSRTKGVYF